MNRRPPHVALAALLLVPMLGVACGDTKSTSPPTTPGAVNVIDNSFDPKTVRVAVGDTVTWTFKGSVAHNVTGPGFTSSNQKSGTFAHQFNSAGSFNYVCSIHAGMDGTVKVG